MQKLSVLIFSNDKADKTLKLVNDIYDICDQIVLIDASDKVDFAKIKKSIKGKVNLYRTLALGYPDPLRAYGLSKCKHDWVLYLDTDERINPEFKTAIRQIMSNPGCDAFAVKRLENSHLDGSDDGFFTWQTRLYNRKKILYRGLVHEQPIVKGKLKRLDENYTILHVTELKTKGSQRRDLEYNTIKKYYDRLSYEMLNQRMKEYLEKMVVPEDKKIEQTAIGKIVLGWMKFYQAVTLRKMHNELSTFDYFVFFSMIEGTYTLKMKDIKYLFGEAIPTVVRDTKNTSQFKKEEYGKEIFEISKQINKQGIIKYLMLDNEKVVNKLYEKYKDKKQGISLLMKLLEDRYNDHYP